MSWLSSGKQVYFISMSWLASVRKCCFMLASGLASMEKMGIMGCMDRNRYRFLCRRPYKSKAVSLAHSRGSVDVQGLQPSDENAIANDVILSNSRRYVLFAVCFLALKRLIITLFI